MKLRQTIIFSALILASGSSVASTSKDFFNDTSIGFQNTLYATGVSIKKPLAEKISFQGVAGITGAVQSLQGRTIYHIKKDSVWSPYAYGSVGVWSVSTAFSSGSGALFGIGGGSDYSLGNLDASLQNWSASAELSLGTANFGGLVSSSSLALGLGLHYKF